MFMFSLGSICPRKDKRISVGEFDVVSFSHILKMIFSYFDVKNAHFMILIIKIVLLQDLRRKCDLKVESNERARQSAVETPNFAMARSEISPRREKPKTHH